MHPWILNGVIAILEKHEEK